MSRFSLGIVTGLLMAAASNLLGSVVARPDRAQGIAQAGVGNAIAAALVAVWFVLLDKVWP